MKLIVELNGVDPKTGEDICLFKFESSEYSHDFLLHKINAALDEGGEKYGGRLDRLRVCMSNCRCRSPRMKRDFGLHFILMHEQLVN